MKDYASLPAPLRAKVDEAAAKTMAAFPGLSQDEARDLVLEHLLTRTVNDSHGTGH
jgi:hypothetical protein